MLQYLGFSIVAGGRLYSFSVSGKPETTRRFTMFVGDVCFAAGALKYQEGPGVCYRKLTSALHSEESDAPLAAEQHLNQADVADFKQASAPKGKPWTEKRRQEAKERLKAAPVRNAFAGAQNSAWRR